MFEDVETGGRSTLVSDSYYHDGARWERDIYRRLELSRNAWRVVAGLIGLALLAVLVALFMLIPLNPPRS